MKRRRSVKHCNFTESKREQTKAIQSERKQAENNKFSKVKTFCEIFFRKFEADDEERGSVYKYMTDRRRNPTKKNGKI